jgi:hypothetical protein
MLPSGGMADDFELLDKGDLYDLATKLLVNDRDAISKCVEFVLADTKGLWHGRARAKMCRRLKHCELSKEQQAQLVDRIISRLCSGDFAEQFNDQLRFALSVDPQRVFEAALNNLSGSPKGHVRRYSTWVLEHRKSRLT